MSPAFIPKDDRITHEFLFLSLPPAARLVATDHAVKDVTLNKEKLSGILLRLPPRAEQDHIAALLDSADQEIALLKKKLAALRDLKKGLMQKLLSGTDNANKKGMMS